MRLSDVSSIAAKDAPPEETQASEPRMQVTAASSSTSLATPGGETVDFIWHEGVPLEFQFRGLTASSSSSSTVFNGDVLESVNGLPAVKETLSEVLDGPKPLHLRFRRMTAHELRELNEKCISRMELAKKKITSLGAENKELRSKLEGIPNGVPDNPSQMEALQAALDAATLEVSSLKERLHSKEASGDMSTQRQGDEETISMFDEDVPGSVAKQTVSAFHAWTGDKENASREELLRDISALKSEIAHLRGDPTVAPLPTREQLAEKYKLEVEQLKAAQQQDLQTQQEELRNAYEKIVQLTNTQSQGTDELLQAALAELEGMKDGQTALEAARLAAEKQAQAFEADLNSVRAAQEEVIKTNREEIVEKARIQVEQLKAAQAEELKVQRDQLQDAYEKIVQLTHTQAQGTDEELGIALAELEGMKDAQTAFEAARMAAEKQAEAFEADLNAANASRRQLQEQITELERTLASNKATEEELRVQLADLTKKKEDATTRAKEMKILVDQKTTEFTQEKETLKSEHEVLRKEFESKSPERVLELEALLKEKELALGELLQKNRQAVASLRKENSTTQQVTQWEINNAHNDLRQMRTEVDEKRKQVTELESALRTEKAQLAQVTEAHKVAETARAKFEGEVQVLKAEIAVNATHFRRIREEHMEAQRMVSASGEEKEALLASIQEERQQQERLLAESKAEIERMQAQIAAVEKDKEFTQTMHQQTSLEANKIHKHATDIEVQLNSAMSENSDLRGWLTQYQNSSENDAVKRIVELEKKLASITASYNEEKTAHENCRAALSELERLKESTAESEDGDSDENIESELYDFLADVDTDKACGDVYGAEIDLEANGGLSKRGLLKKVAKLQDKLNRRPIVCHYSDTPRTDVPHIFKKLPCVTAAERPMLKLTAKLNRSKSCMWIFFMHLVVLYVYLLLRKPTCPL